MAAGQPPNGGGAYAPNGLNMTNGPIPMGYHQDVASMMQNLETLSQWLARNREDWESVREGMGRLQLASSQDGDIHPLQQNGHTVDSHDDTSHPPTTTQVQPQHELASATSRILSLETTYTEQLRLQALYETTLTDATERIRQYVFAQHQHVKDLHAHYTHLLQQSRYETIEAQLVHQEWQAGLKRVSEGIREAAKSREEEGRPWKARVSALREENRVLRRMVGWEAAPPDSDDEEDGVEGNGGSDGRGRDSRGSLGMGESGGEGMGGTGVLP